MANRRDSGQVVADITPFPTGPPHEFSSSTCQWRHSSSPAPRGLREPPRWTCFDISLIDGIRGSANRSPFWTRYWFAAERRLVMRSNRAGCSSLAALARARDLVARCRCRHGDTIIRLFQTADLSTMLHESGHYF